MTDDLHSVLEQLALRLQEVEDKYRDAGSKARERGDDVGLIKADATGMAIEEIKDIFSRLLDEADKRLGEPLWSDGNDGQGAQG